VVLVVMRRHIKCRPAETGIFRVSIPYTLPGFPGGIRKISARKRPERSRPVPLNCGTGKEWPYDAASRIRISNGQNGSIPFLQGTRRPFQEIFRQPQFFGRLFLKKGANRIRIFGGRGPAPRIRRGKASGLITSRPGPAPHDVPSGTFRPPPSRRDARDRFRSGRAFRNRPCRPTTPRPAARSGVRAAGS